MMTTIRVETTILLISMAPPWSRRLPRAFRLRGENTWHGSGGSASYYAGQKKNGYWVQKRGHPSYCTRCLDTFVLLLEEEGGSPLKQIWQMRRSDTTQTASVCWRDCTTDIFFTKKKVLLEERLEETRQAFPQKSRNEECSTSTIT